MALEATVQKLNDVTAVITLYGLFESLDKTQIVDTQLQLLIEEVVIRLVLDLTASPYADSSGLSVMVHVFGLTEAKGGFIRLCGA